MTDKFEQSRVQTPQHIDKALRLLGLAIRARQAAAGQEAVKQAALRKKASLIWLAEDATPQTKAKISQLAQKQAIRLIEATDKAQLGRYTGRAVCAAVAITDKNFAARICELYGFALESEQ